MENAAATENLDLKMTRLFPVPVYSIMWRNVEGYHVALSRLVDETIAAQEVKQHPGFFNQKGARTDFGFENKDDPTLKVLSARVSAMIQAITKHQINTSFPRGAIEITDGHLQWTWKAWGNSFPQGGEVIPHATYSYDNEASYAGIYFVGSPEKPPILTLKNPNLTPQIIQDYDQPNYDVKIPLVPGQMVIFPASLSYGIGPYSGEGKAVFIEFTLQNPHFALLVNKVIKSQKEKAAVATTQEKLDELKAEAGELKKTADGKIDSLPEDRKEKVKKRAEELLAEEQKRQKKNARARERRAAKKKEEKNG